MKLTFEFEPIRQWAYHKGILTNGDLKTQLCKLTEEQGELAAAILRGDKAKAIDAIGDCVVVLTSLAHLNGTTIEQCINAAYDVIKDRTGEMQDGNFVKQDDLTPKSSL